MDMRELLNKMIGLQEGETVVKGNVTTHKATDKYGAGEDEPDEDDSKDKKAEPSEKRGRGRPSKEVSTRSSTGDAAANKKYSADALHKAMSTPKNLKDWMEQLDKAIVNEDGYTVAPLPGATAIKDASGQVVATAANPQAAAAFKNGDITLGGEDDKQGMAEGDEDAVDINQLASQMKFLPTRKKILKYNFIPAGQQMTPMSYRLSDQDGELIKTITSTDTADKPETKNVALKGDVVMSGPSGENYVVKGAKFGKLYDGNVGGIVYPEQGPRMVAAYTGQQVVNFTAPWGESMIMKPGDYLVKGDDGYYRVAEAEYKQTYNEPGQQGVAEGEWWKDKWTDKDFARPSLLGTPKLSVEKASSGAGLVVFTGRDEATDAPFKKLLANLQRNNPRLAAQGRITGSSLGGDNVVYGIEFPTMEIAHHAAKALSTFWSPEAYEGVAEDEMADFMAGGGKITQLPYKKPRKCERLGGSRHIGGNGDTLTSRYKGISANTKGFSANTKGKAIKGVAEGMGSSSPTRVMRKYLPKGMWDPILSHSGKSKHDNADGSKTSNVWRLRNLTRSWQGREFDAWKQAVEQELGNGYKVTSEWPTPSVRHIQMNDISAQQGVAEGKLEESIMISEGNVKALFSDLLYDLENSGPGYDINDALSNGDSQKGEKIIRRTLNHDMKYCELPHSEKEKLVDAALEHYFEEDAVDEGLIGAGLGAVAGGLVGEPVGVLRGASIGNTIGNAISGPEPTQESNPFKRDIHMKSNPFESWEKQLNTLLNEGMTVTSSTGQQGAPDSVSINATDADAQELLSIVRQAGLGVFGGGENTSSPSAYGAPSPKADPEGHGTQPELSPNVVGDGDDMLSMIKKMSGIQASGEQPTDVEVVDAEPSSDYEDEDEDNDELDEFLDLDVKAGNSSASGGSGGGDAGVSGTTSTGGSSGASNQATGGTSSAKNTNSTDMTSTTTSAAAAGQGAKAGNNMEEDDMEEGNAFTGKLKSTPQGGNFKLGNKTFKDTSSIEEGHCPTCDCAPCECDEGKCNECGMAEDKCECHDEEHVEESLANSNDDAAMQDLHYMLDSLSGGLNGRKRSQATGNIIKVTTETKLMKESTGLLLDFQKLSGIK